MKYFVRLTLILAMMCGSSLAVNADTMRFGNAGSPAKNLGCSASAATGWQFPDSYYGGAIIWLTPEKRELFAGNHISKLIFYHGTINDENVTKINCFASEGLNGTELFDEDVPVKEYGQAAKVEYELNPPLLIEPGTENLCVGWRVNITTQKHADSNIYCCDMIRNLPEYNNDAISFNNDKWGFEDYNGVGGNMCIWLEITGDDLPVNDISIHNLSLPEKIYPNQEFTYKFSIQNRGLNDINGITVETTLGNEEPTVDELQFTSPLAYGARAECTLSGTYPATGVVPIKVRVAKLDGVDDSDPADNEASGYSMAITSEDGFERNVLIEEATGTWCAYCPRGIVGMKAITEKYAADGRLVLISIHGEEADPMALDTYKLYNKYFIPTYPLSTVDRKYRVQPNFDTLEAGYLDRLKEPAYSRLELEATSYEEENRVEISSDATFYFNDFGERYKIAYVLVENQVGPHPQANAYAGGETEMGGFEKLEDPTPVVFDDVAVSSTEALGLEGVYPDELEAGKAYGHVQSLTLPENCKLADCRVVAYLINASSNVIENCAQTTVIKSGLKGVETDLDDAPVHFYNLQGLRVEPSAPGVYIRCQGNKRAKVIIR